MGQRNGLQLGVVGVGRIGAFHARTLVGLADVASVTIADADRSRADQVAAELGVRSVDTPEALVDQGVDALVIACATPGHAPLLRLAASAGLPAFCEKPVALDLPTLDAVLDDTARAGILVQVGFQRRFDAGYRAAHEAVAAGSYALAQLTDVLRFALAGTRADRFREPVALPPSELPADVIALLE